ncbi:MAG: DUF255 domain-containing protein [Verrucomicrobiota bacterium]
MNSTIISKLVGTAVMGAMLLGGSSCRKRTPAAMVESPATVAPELRSNGMAGLPGGVYAGQASSPIHWQPWSKAVFEHAKAAKRLVFLVIAVPQQTAFRKVLSELAADANLVTLINEQYVPVLVDGDAAREVGLLTADLAAEIQRPLQLPLLVWLTPEANPVAWIPVSAEVPKSARDLFYKSHAMVNSSWVKNPEYVTNNSAMDNQGRRARLTRRTDPARVSKDPAADVLKAIRQLVSLYDPGSRSFDKAGGLFPSGVIDLLASAAIHPELPKEIRALSLKTVQELMADLLPSAMFDPLDGGLFASRRAATWAYAVFDREANSQARAIVALCRAYQATGNPLALERALGVLAFAEKTYATRDGLFALGSAPGTLTKSWLWSVEEIQKTLPPQDAAWWIAATGMRGLGNLPSEDDPTREFFRCNTLGLVKPMAQIAAELALTPDAFKPRFETARKMLLKVREERLGAAVRDETAHAATTFRMVSAYAAAFGATGNPALRDKAVTLLEQARKTFTDGPQLWMYATKTPPPIAAGRAFLYSLAIQAALDLADITGEEKWLAWADDLASTAAERFTESNFLKECPDNAKVLDLPISDLVMLFDDSTAGLMSFAECRLAARKRPLVEAFSRLAVMLPRSVVERPVLHTDLIQAALVRHYAPLLVLGKDLPEPLQTAVERLPLRQFKQRAGVGGDAVPSGAVKIILPDGSARMAATPDDLRDVLLPSGGNG